MWVDASSVVWASASGSSSAWSNSRGSRNCRCSARDQSHPQGSPVVVQDQRISRSEAVQRGALRSPLVRKDALAGVLRDKQGSNGNLPNSGRPRG
jgi:hypothetical protein